MPFGQIISSEKDIYLVRIDGNVDSFSETDKEIKKNIFCKGKGAFRDKAITPIVGDYVEISISGKEGTILKVMERRNLLLRPPVANVDQVLVFQTIVSPDINSLMFDKLLAVIEKRKLPIIIGFNKIDLVDSEVLEEWINRYLAAGYHVYSFNSITGEGIDELKEALKGKITAIAGPSGAGKSTLIKRLTGSSLVEVGSLSQKTSRGKQTTRKSHLFEIDEDSFIFDTPGFSSLDLRDFKEGKEIISCFPEIKDYSSDCRFRNCMHIKEIDCAVLNAVKEGKIDSERHRNYVKLFEEIEAGRKF